MTKPKPQLLSYVAGPKGVTVPGTRHVIEAGRPVEFMDDDEAWMGAVDSYLESGVLLNVPEEEPPTEILTPKREVHVKTDGADDAHVKVDHTD